MRRVQHAVQKGLHHRSTLLELSVSLFLTLGITCQGPSPVSCHRPGPRFFRIRQIRTAPRPFYLFNLALFPSSPRTPTRPLSLHNPPFALVPINLTKRCPILPCARCALSAILSPCTRKYGMYSIRASPAPAYDKMWGKRPGQDRADASCCALALPRVSETAVSSPSTN